MIIGRIALFKACQTSRVIAIKAPKWVDERRVVLCFDEYGVTIKKIGIDDANKKNLKLHPIGSGWFQLIIKTDARPGKLKIDEEDSSNDILRLDYID